jgi:hypothetical protein
MDVDAWLQALQTRHRSLLRSSEFLKALRALSARYVERRATLPDRSPLDSAGKRAAFAAFYAPLHFLTTRAIVRALREDARSIRPPLDTIVDLGCGTGVAGASWALDDQAARSAERPAARVLAIDMHPWAISEAAWNLACLGVHGSVSRGDLVMKVERLAAKRHADLHSTGLIAAWSVNELAAPDRRRLLPALVTAARAGATIVVLEPLARSAAPWWDEWADQVIQAGGRADEWRLPAALPALLAEIDEAAGFRRAALTARSLWLAL